MSDKILICLQGEAFRLNKNLDDATLDKITKRELIAI